jgi:hypothetical protein
MERTMKLTNTQIDKLFKANYDPHVCNIILHGDELPGYVWEEIQGILGINSSGVQLAVIGVKELGTTDTPDTDHLSDEERSALSDRLNEVERTHRRWWGLDKISGGYVHATFSDHDENYIYINLKGGVQSDCQNTVTSNEDLTLDRKTLDWTVPEVA